MKENIRATKIGKSGYIYVLDAKEGHDYGKLQIHPIKEGQNFIDSRDSGGRAFIREILEKKEGTIRYPWINKELGDTKVRDKLVAYRPLKEWNWIVCAGSWLDELNSEAGTLLKAMIGATTLVAMVLVLLFRNMLGVEKRLTTELQQRLDEYQEAQEELQVTEEMLRAQVDDYMQSQDELQATEEMLREQIDAYQTTHEQLLATEEMLRVQLALAEENSQKFKVVFDNSPLTVALTTFPEGSFYELNEAFVTTFGYSREEAIGKTTLDLALWLKNEDHSRYLQLFRENGYVHNFEARMRCKGGAEITVLISGALVEISGRACVLNAVMNITEQKRLQDQLHQSQKMDVVGQLAGGIAHDFNNMLTGIMAAAELLKIRLPSDEKSHKWVDTIIDATNRSADLTRELLSFSRKGTEVCHPVRIHDSIASVISLLERTIDKQIQLKVSLEANNPVVMGDQTQLQNALLNLGVNARDAMPHGGILAFATAENVLDEAACQSRSLTLAPGSYLEIVVSDTGVGMTKAVIEHIFEPFFTTKEIDKGTGLGLAAVYVTVKNHGGEIIVQSHPGHGSTFRIFLPLVAVESSKQAPQAEAVTGSGGILLVDDEEILRSVGRELLEQLGYTLYLAENGEHALEVFAAHQKEISLVMLDMIMPKMGGTETFMRLRELAPDLKVLFCSGFSREETGAELMGLGASGFYQKPYSRIELSLAVAKALEAGVTSSQ